MSERVQIQIPSYTILRSLGEGGMGEVYLAQRDGLIPLPQSNGIGGDTPQAGPSRRFGDDGSGKVMASASPLGGLFR